MKNGAPSVKNVHFPTDLMREVIKADPDWPRDRSYSREYVFAGRNGEIVFLANVDKRGAYNPANRQATPKK